MERRLFLSLFLPICLFGFCHADNKADPVCWIKGQCFGEFLHNEFGVQSKEDCLNVCQNFEECNWFTFMESSSACFLMADCNSIEDGCQDCLSGESRCQVPEEESEWHLIIGGETPNERISASVELFNWKTGEQCLLKDLPYPVATHTGTVVNGIPVYCGGYSIQYETKCFQLNKTTQVWEQIADMSKLTSNAASVFVPSNGLFVFGGNYLKHSQKLASLDGQWEKGPNLYQDEKIDGACIVQLNSTTTGFFDAMNYKITFDWTTMNYTNLPTEPSYDRRVCTACSLLNGKNGEKLLAAVVFGAIVADFAVTQLAVWNPNDGSVTTLISEIFEVNAMVSVKNGEELIMYQHYGDRGGDGIFKYVRSDNFYALIGRLLVPRISTVVLPVTGMSCP